MPMPTFSSKPNATKERVRTRAKAKDLTTINQKEEARRVPDPRSQPDLKSAIPQLVTASDTGKTAIAPKEIATNAVSSTLSSARH